MGEDYTAEEKLLLERLSLGAQRNRAASPLPAGEDARRSIIRDGDGATGVLARRTRAAVY
jgi:hypothetical protein